MKSVDLNSDLGESFGAYKIGNDENVLPFISSANIACGYHAGDHNVMMKTVELAKSLGVSIGAHPGFPDLGGFGRRDMNMSPDEVYNLVAYQVGAIQGVANVHQATVYHVKPHGALYNKASKDSAIAKAIANAIYAVNPDLVLYGLAGSELVKAGKACGLTVAEEVFADRTYQQDGTLTPRTEPNAMIHDADEAVERVIRMITEGKVTAVNGSDISIQADTICVHGDEPEALLFVQKLRERIEENGIEIKRVGVNASV
ncbi:LamB/YcsF family protein [Guptibacillus hwajinpoensis]|uniref:LamB/YcsF family protein n=1 Tax=Guptibacillus hwajinpoensis TaxID=208199 RepID=UPI001883A8C3|nr:5-oxoprolinase subunit PxpA [Pseudalkalibacillus hwajinpoensis]MBF0707421.1 LamB/YcsF family protein [Pseudalkalibacillus hwajinpoensis]WLR58825.1 5-oxoprolinase subunit PxpA [Pseudalkalibacillus hwajinpoensis]